MNDDRYKYDLMLKYIDVIDRKSKRFGWNEDQLQDALLAVWSSIDDLISSSNISSITSSVHGLAAYAAERSTDKQYRYESLSSAYSIEDLYTKNHLHSFALLGSIVESFVQEEGPITFEYTVVLMEIISEITAVEAAMLLKVSYCSYSHVRRRFLRKLRNCVFFDRNLRTDTSLDVVHLAIYSDFLRYFVEVCEEVNKILDNDASC